MDIFASLYIRLYNSLVTPLEKSSFFIVSPLLAVSFFLRRKTSSRVRIPKEFKNIREICRNCRSFPTKFSTKFDQPLNRNSSRPVSTSSPGQFFLPSFGGSNYFSFSAFPYIRSTKPSNWIPTVTYNPCPGNIAAQNLYSFLLLNIPGNEDKCVGSGPANCHDTAHILLLSSICRLSSPPSKYYNFATTLTEIHISFAIIVPIFLSRIVLFLFIYAEDVEVMNFD